MDDDVDEIRAGAKIQVDGRELIFGTVVVDEEISQRQLGDPHVHVVHVEYEADIFGADDLESEIFEDRGAAGIGSGSRN